jgi:RNA polymerase sigma-70 factor (ECF subfamily)
VPTADIARLFLVPEPTMAARITRAKKRIVGAGIPFAVPDASVLPDRLDVVAQTAYLAFTAGYSPGTGPDLLRAEASGEAIRLVRVVLGLRPDEPSLVGLLALMLLQHSRRDARVRDRRLVLLADQDRTRWDRALVAEGQELVRRCLRRDQPGPYQVQAAIQAVHSEGTTDWRQIVQLYDQLLALTPTPVVALNRAVAVAEIDGPAVALSLVDRLDLPDYALIHGIRADLLRRLGRGAEAEAEYGRALELTANEAERAFYRGRLGTFGAESPSGRGSAAPR